MDAGAAVDRMVEKSRAAASALGEMLEAIHEVASASPDPDFAAVEVAFGLRLTRFAAEDQVWLARELCVRLPQVLQSLIAADIDLARARVFADVLGALDIATAREVAAVVLPVAPEKTTGQLRDLLRRRALAVDPAFTKAQRERAQARRGVQVHAADDGTATLVAFGVDAARLTVAFARIGAVARARRLTGAATGKLEQVRADVLLELLEGQHAGAAAGVTQITVSLETLAQLRNDPGYLARYGPVAADIARQWVEAHPGFQWQCAVRGSDGTLLQQGLTRARPSDPPANTIANGTRVKQAAHAGRPRERCATNAKTDSQSADAANTSPHTPAATNASQRRPVATNAGTDRSAVTNAGTHGTAATNAETDRSAAANAGIHGVEGAGLSRPGCSAARVGQADEEGSVRNGPPGRMRPVPDPVQEHPEAAPAQAEARRQSWMNGLARPPEQDPRDRFASAAMTRWIRMRDVTCRAPGCRMPAVRCDIDHSVGYAAGGTTTHGNLCALCRRHHRVKDNGGWIVVQIKPGHFRWISPAGKVYDVGPEPP